MFGSAIRKIRKEKGLTVEQLGDMVGVSHATISRYERGARTPSGQNLQKIAQALGVSVYDLREIERAISEETPGRPELAGYVSKSGDIQKWNFEVLESSDIGDIARLMLIHLPKFLDRTSWVVATTIDEFADKTGRSKELVEAHWSELASSPHVERVGRNEWTFRLRLRGG